VFNYTSPLAPFDECGTAPVVPSAPTEPATPAVPTEPIKGNSGKGQGNKPIK